MTYGTISLLSYLFITIFVTNPVHALPFIHHQRSLAHHIDSCTTELLHTISKYNSHHPLALTSHIWLHWSRSHLRTITQSLSPNHTRFINLGLPLALGRVLYAHIATLADSYLMPSSHCTILARFFTRRQVLINRRQMPEIGGKSVLVPASDNRAVWIIKDAIWGNRRCVADGREIFGMLNIWSCRRFTSLLCEWVLTGSDWKIHRRWPTANERARYRAAGSSRRSFFFFFFFFFFFTKWALEYTEQVGCMKIEKRLGFFL